MAVKTTKGYTLEIGGRVGARSAVGAGNYPFSEQLPFAVPSIPPVCLAIQEQL